MANLDNHGIELAPSRGAGYDNDDFEKQHIVEDQEEKNLSRSLKQRHIQMIALAGAIGTGLFLSLGSALQTGGPLGALLGYALIGAVVCSVQFALGETSALFPVTGSFVRHAEFLFDPALGFAVGWNVVYGAYLSVPAEISAALVLIQFWTEKYAALWITIFIVLTFLVGIIFIGVYGEIEFWLAILKIMLIVGIILMGLIIDLGGVPGQGRIGFRYWNHPGPFSQYLEIPGAWGRFLGFWAVMNNAVYSFSGIESLSVAAAETQNPRQNIPRACKRVFARVTLFYILAVLIVGMIVSSTDDDLNNYSGNASQSPFVLAATRAGIKAVPSIINAVVLTSAWSAGNQSMLAGTRILYGLALKGQAPRFLLLTTRWGIPWVCVIAQTLVACLAYMSLSNNALTVFYWFLDLTASAVLISWSAIAWNHIRLHQALKRQGIVREELPWHHWWTPYTSWFALVSCIIFLLTGGFTVFIKGNWDKATFISAYLDIPLVLTAYFGWKFLKKTRILSLDDVPLRAALDEIVSKPEEEVPKARGWRRLNILWG
ncbi:putative amino acid permease [Mytilinidion resinicola]|uniref:Amino acid permease n=1 Tax=Mytilinidion resinicola TaxID=574789 RepID=A0A6A6YQR2_9PEZI|nr:putative amino acid permease [Mytilinidion resinicola]KAF2811242.1 putative amino acid permease [Mytilinidion resinicola]